MTGLLTFVPLFLSLSFFFLSGKIGLGQWTYMVAFVLRCG
jgi:hypothetical protein